MAGGLNLYGYAGGDPVNNHDPLGLDVVFKNDAEGELQHAWNHAKRVLRSRTKNDAEASNALILMRRMENSEATFEFEVGTVFGAHGASLGTHATIDTDAIRRSSAAGLSIGIGSVLVHEAGHLAYQNSAMYALQPNSELSNLTAVSWENAYRRGVCMPQRSSHHNTPRRSQGGGACAP